MCQYPSHPYLLSTGLAVYAAFIEMSTGYGPHSSKLPIIFNGDPESYELWEIKFVSHLRLRKLHDVLAQDSPDAEKNANVFAELVQCLDDRSLTLIFRDAKDDGKKSLEILRQHYLGQSKPRIISLYTELTSISKSPDESCTDYVLRAEKLPPPPSEDYLL